MDCTCTIFVAKSRFSHDAAHMWFAIFLTGDHPCSNVKTSGCSHLCLPSKGQEFTCSCPTYGGLSLANDGKTCQSKENDFSKVQKCASQITLVFFLHLKYNPWSAKPDICRFRGVGSLYCFPRSPKIDFNNTEQA